MLTLGKVVANRYQSLCVLVKLYRLHAFSSLLLFSLFSSLMLCELDCCLDFRIDGSSSLSL